jgi:hypothetical protein
MVVSAEITNCASVVWAALTALGCRYFPDAYGLFVPKPS